jgi:hypothetical protein
MACSGLDKCALAACVTAQPTSAAPCAPASATYEGPKGWTPEEAAQGNKGIRWVTETYVAGRPSEHDVLEYLEIRGEDAKCGCAECKRRLAALASPAAPCKGMNCGATDGRNHSPECEAEHAAAIAGGTFVPAAGMTLRQRCDTALQCLPEAPLRAQLARLFEDLLAAPAAAGMPQPVATWRCFHCDEVFTEEAAAREHFGSSERQQPACAIDIAEYRRMEEAHRRQCEDDTDWHRAFYKLGCDHTQAMRQHGDAEYARGLRDGVNLPADSPERAALFAPPTPASEVAQDAARYRWLRDKARSVDWSSYISRLTYRTHCRTSGTEMDPPRRHRMSADLDRLEAIAKAASPGPWRNAGYDGHGGMRVESIQWQIGYVSRAGGKQEANAEHIATFSPERVLALLAVARAAKRMFEFGNPGALMELGTALAGLEQLEDRT